MSEPITKKSGSFYRNEKTRKNKLHDDIVRKTTKIDSFFNKQTTEFEKTLSCHAEQSNDEFLSSDIESIGQVANKNRTIFNGEWETQNVIDSVRVDDENIGEDVNNNTREVNDDDNSESESRNLIDCWEADDDPSKWRVGDADFVEQIVRNPIKQDFSVLDFSKSKKLFTGTYRYCSSKLFFKTQVNGEVVQRAWIFYSQSLGKVFCIYCKLFGQKVSPMFTESGFNDWKHPNLIENHEKSTSHYASARVFAQRLLQDSSLTAQLSKQISNETNYWREILKRILSVIRFLSSRGLPFRGSNQTIGNSSNGNYLGLLELIAEYDAMLHTHIEKYGNKGRGHVSYLSANIADEFIHLIADKVRSTLVLEIRRSKYFALIVDSTPDVSHIDQLTIVFRFVDRQGVAVEKFLAFLSNAGHKGAEMEISVVDFLKKTGIFMIDCRGQAYDNAPNMCGKYKGLRTRILEINPLAIYVPCGTHKLNLTVNHAADSSPVAVRFFMFVQNIYVFFSDSTKRWDILTKHLKSDLDKRDIKDERMLVPKRLSDTRWSARADALRALKAGYGSFISALEEISENKEEKMIYRIEAGSLRDEFFKLETATLLGFWACILNRVNNTSKALQQPSIDIQTSILLYETLINFVTKLRNEESINDFILRGEVLVEENLDRCDLHKDLEVKFNCYEKRTKKRNTRYDSRNAPDTIFSDRDNFRANVLFPTLDSILTELRSTANGYSENMSPFIFLTQLENEKFTDTDLREQAENLRKKYPSDLDEGLFNECIQFKAFMEDINAEIEKDLQDLKKKYGDDDEKSFQAKLLSKPGRMLQYIIKTNIQAAFPNIYIALRILETIPSCNASGERSFSSLKHIKSPLCSTQTQQHLNDLAMLFMNSDILNEIDLDPIITSFASSKARLVRI